MTRVYEAAKDTAKKIRVALKEAFPQLPKTHFKIRANGYDAVNISWVDFPSIESVEAVTNRFKGGRYDMHEDYHSNVGYEYEGQTIIGAQYIFHTIDYTPERKAAVKEIMEYVYGDINHMNQHRYFTEIASEFNAEGEYVGKHRENYLNNKRLTESDTQTVLSKRMTALDNYFQALNDQTNINIDRFESIVERAIDRLPKEWGVKLVSTPTHYIAEIQGNSWLAIHPLYITNLQSGYDIYAHAKVSEAIKTKGQQAKIDTQLLDWYLMMLTEPFRKIHNLTAKFGKSMEIRDADMVERSMRLAKMVTKIPENTLKEYSVKLIKVGKVGGFAEVRFLVPTQEGRTRYLAVTPLTIRWADNFDIVYATTDFNLSEMLQQLGVLVNYVDINALRLIKTTIQKAYDKRYAITD